MDYYLRLGDVPGTSSRLGYEDSIEVLSFSLGSTRDPAGGTLESLSLVLPIDSSTPLILALVQTHQSVDAVLVCVRFSGQENVEFVRMSFGSARATSLALSGAQGDNTPLGSLTIEYRSMNIGVTRMSPEGIPLDTVQYGYECTDPPKAAG